MHRTQRGLERPFFDMVCEDLNLSHRTDPNSAVCSLALQLYYLYSTTLVESVTGREYRSILQTVRQQDVFVYSLVPGNW
jgi:hypothetical protein